MDFIKKLRLSNWHYSSPIVFEKLRLGFELLMFYYVEPSSVFLKPSFILRLRFC